MTPRSSRRERVAVAAVMRTAARDTQPAYGSGTAVQRSVTARGRSVSRTPSRTTPATAAPSSRSSRAVWLAAAAAGLLGMIVAGGVLLASRLDSTHSVAGTLLLDERPLAGVEVTFQRKHGPDVFRARTGDRGEFWIDDLPPGDYVILVVPADSSVRVPMRYLSAKSTPFRLNLSKDRSDLRMLAVSK